MLEQISHLKDPPMAAHRAGQPRRRGSRRQSKHPIRFHPGKVDDPPDDPRGRFVITPRVESNLYQKHLGITMFAMRWVRFG